MREVNYYKCKCGGEIKEVDSPDLMLYGKECNKCGYKSSLEYWYTDDKGYNRTLCTKFEAKCKDILKFNQDEMTFKKYKKKPVVIEAIRWDGRDDTLKTIKENVEVIRSKNEKIVIPTLEGDMTADLGDWIIKGVGGEFYPCKPDIFEKTYDVV